MLRTWTMTTLVAACLLGVASSNDAVAGRPSPPNREPLQSQPYLRLPLGSVQAKGWLKHQLQLQRDGLTGHAEELYDDIGRSDWVADEKRGGQFAWERGPYYAKGLIALAYVLDDPELKKKSRRWIDRVIAGQRADGDFGPKQQSWWPNMIVLHYLRDEYEASGDERIVEFMERYFRFQLKALPEHPLVKDSRWAMARGGDELEIVLWLYNLKGQRWLMDLARLLVEQTNQWDRYYADRTGRNAYPEHIVNVMQGLKTPPLEYLVTGSEQHKAGFVRGTSPDGWLMREYGRVDGMVSGTEPLTDLSSTQGTETCAIVERILSNTVAIKILGAAAIGDQLERVAYNALPAALAPDIRGLRYYSLPNQPQCVNEKLGFRHNGDHQNSICPSPHSGYACCRSNFHFGWPKFVHNMWMATRDGGLAVAAYGPNRVTATLGQHATEVTIDQTTDYPFREEATLSIAATEPVAFPLELRIPGWCARPTVRVNDQAMEGVKAGEFYRIEREWRAGDVVQVHFPMRPTLSHWINDSVAVQRGPLVFSLLIQEERISTQSFLDGAFHTYEIRPASPWNYALLLADPNRVEAETVVSASMPEQPFLAADAPVRLRLKAVRTTAGGWGNCREDFPARAVEPPPSPVDASGPPEEIVLVPYGSTQIRVTCFPWAKQ